MVRVRVGVIRDRIMVRVMFRVRVRVKVRVLRAMRCTREIVPKQYSPRPLAARIWPYVRP